MNDMTNESTSNNQKPTLLTGLVMLLIVIACIIAWVILGTMLNFVSLYASFLFLWYWGTVEQANFKRLAPAMLGSLAGIAVGAGLSVLPTMLGTSGLVLAIAIGVVSIYLVIIDRIPLVFNPALTLFLTVVAAPAILQSSDFVEIMLVTLTGGLFFALCVFVVIYVAAKSQGIKAG